MRKTIICLIALLILSLIITPFFTPAKAQGSPTVSLVPSQIQVTQVNQVFMVNITISNVQNLWAWDMNLTWNPASLSLIAPPTEGDFMQSVGDTVPVFSPQNATGGYIPDMSDTFLEEQSVSGSGVLATLQFKVISQTSSNIQLNITELQGPPTTVKGVDQPVPGAQITPTATTATTTVTFASTGAPAANAGPNQTVKVGSTVTFDGSKSLSSGANATYTWTFTDVTPQTLSGIKPSYAFNNSGIYQVTLTLQDSNGVSNSTMLVIVQGPPPVAVITIEGNPQTLETQQPITFDSSNSSGTIRRYLWNMGDEVGTGTNSSITYTYTKAGTYNVTLTVFDNADQNNTTYQEITVAGSGSGGSTSTSTQTSTPTPTPQSTAAPTSGTPAPGDSTVAGGSVPAYVVALLVIFTLMVFGGSISWLRKRT